MNGKIDNCSTYKLCNGIEIPTIGFGTWQIPNDSVGSNAVANALNMGYRHIDTAQAYQNEECVGEALRISGIDRDTVFITTKIANENHSYDLVMSSFENSLRLIGTSYIDLLLIHWPNPAMYRSRWEEANAETWKAMEELYAAGKVRALGISNFRAHHIVALQKTAKVQPMINQIRICPGEAHDDVEDYCRSMGMRIEAYSPLGTGSVFKMPQIVMIARKYNKTVSQVCIRWSIQKGYIPLPKTVTPERIKENYAVFDFELKEEDMQVISELEGTNKNMCDPDTVPF
ncbi:MAG: aldo/keto reductase [Lachnospiraceae bacterium]|nr:aldo/keto reductase [Lachnospiraceae bacterium]